MQIRQSECPTSGGFLTQDAGYDAYGADTKLHGSISRQLRGALAWEY